MFRFQSTSRATLLRQPEGKRPGSKGCTGRIKIQGNCCTFGALKVVQRRKEVKRRHTNAFRERS